MALELPGFAVKGLQFLGYDFPQTNEDVLHEWADHLRAMESTFAGAATSLEGALRHLQGHNQGPALEAFAAMATDADSDGQALQRFREGTDIAAKGCDVCATAVVILKGVVIAQAIAAVPAAAGGPITFMGKRLLEMAIDRAVEAALSKILGGE